MNVARHRAARHCAIVFAAAALTTSIAGGCAATTASTPTLGSNGPLFEPMPDQLPLARWSEGVEAADVDRDGDLDLFFADGQAFVAPGPKLQNQLEINRLNEAIASWSNESVVRLGAHASHAKMVVTGDIDGDGWIDALFCNAFNTDPPSLYHNRGDSEPGWFDLESAERGFQTPYNSGSGQFGDIDDDGDLDLVLCDSGEHLLMGAGGVPHLFLNDGAGHFAEHPERLPLSRKRARVDVQMADLDGDFDLDLLFANRAENEGSNHDLALNDGTGHFSVASELIPNASKNVYEIEVGDLDGDRDLDLFFISLADFSEGPVENRITPDSILSFVAGTPIGDLDDNELALFDFDMDGDYDVIVGSLAGEEKILRNDGAFVFTQVDGPITGVEDPTLDLTIADVDGDGRYDLITAQGEGDPTQFTNRVYLNRGARDTLPPAIEAVSDALWQGASNAWLVHARVRDQVMDDGQDWVSASGRYRVAGGAWRPAHSSRMAGGLWRFALADDAGARTRGFDYELTFVDAAGNTTRTPRVHVAVASAER